MNYMVEYKIQVTIHQRQSGADMDACDVSLSFRDQDIVSVRGSRAVCAVAMARAVFELLNPVSEGEAL